jgi:hypothetical protein
LTWSDEFEDPLRDQAASMETVWIYFDELHEVGHPDHVRVFATRETAEKWLADIDPHGTIFEYDVLGRRRIGTSGS